MQSVRFSAKKSLANLSDTFSLGMLRWEVTLAYSSLILPRPFLSLSLSSFSLVVSLGGERRGVCDFERHRRAQGYLKVPKTFGEQVSLKVTRIAVLSASSRLAPFSSSLLRHIVPMTREIGRGNSGPSGSIFGDAYRR